MQSPSNRERAWGAWYAGTSHDPAFVPLLLDRLREAQSLRNSPRDGADYAYVQSLFDALIQLRATVPTAVLLPFEDSRRSEILILMNGARAGLDADAEPALLAMRERKLGEESEDEWAAINDLLFVIDPKTATQNVLGEIRVTHEFCVSDRSVIRADDGSGGVGLSTRRFPAGFPPIGLYQIRTFAANPGDSIFPENPIPTRYTRIVVPTGGEAQWFQFSFHGASTSTRQRTVERLLKIFEPATERKSPDEIFHPWTAVDWQGTEKTGAAISALLDDQAAEIRAVLQEIARRGALPVPHITLPIEVTVRDCRRDVREPLPFIARIREVSYP